MTNSSNLKSLLLEQSVFTIGNVSSVKGKDIIIKVNKDKNLPHLFYQGKTIKNVSVGLSNYLKIMKGFTEIICKVEGEYLEVDRFQASKSYTNEQQKMTRYLNVSVFGFYDGKKQFQHGIKEMPLIGSECRLLSKKEFEDLHKLSIDGEIAIPLGTLIDEETQKVEISAKKLFAGHIGIFGNTGSGKSNTLARIYTELFRQKSGCLNFSSRSTFIFIDFNGEYSSDSRDDKILTEDKEVYRLRTKDKNGDKYPLMKADLEKIETLSILLDATEKTQQPFLYRAIERKWLDTDNIGSAKEVNSIKEKLRAILSKGDRAFNVSLIWQFVKDFEALGFQIVNPEKSLDQLKYHSSNHSFYWYNPDSQDTIYSDSSLESFFGPMGLFNISVMSSFSTLQKIQFKILDQYYHEIINGYANQEHISPLIGRLKKKFDMIDRVFELRDTEPIPKNIKKNIRVINLKNVNLDMKKIVPLLICKNCYDEQKATRDTEKNNSLHIIIDEAHNILSESSNRESESWKDYRLETFEEIIKEGRKFGVFLTISSQRPSDISPTIISQLHNYFIHRLMNENDLRAINRAVSYLDKLSFDSISNLSTGCCFIAGQMSQFPLSVKVDQLKKSEQPQSETIDLEVLWDDLV